MSARRRMAGRITTMSCGLVALALLPASTRAQSSSAADPAAIAGCYRVIIYEPWSPALGAAVDYYAIPPIIRLDSATTPTGERTVSPDLNYPRPPRRSFRGWVARGDSVFVSWSNGFTGVVLRLAREEPGRLHGQAMVRGDVRRPGTVFPHAGVNVERAECAERP